MHAADFTPFFPMFRKGQEKVVRTLVGSGEARGIIPRDYADLPSGRFMQWDRVRAVWRDQDIQESDTGREITLYEIGPGETCILNASCILSGKTYPAHALSLADLTVLLVPADVFQKMIKQYESMREFVFTLLSQRLTGVMELVVEIAFGRMDERLKDYLVQKSDNSRIETTHQKIANDLGISREVVIRLLKDLERHGAVKLSRNTITLQKL